MVFVLDANKTPLDMCHSARARKLLKLLREAKYTKINIDENCIVGWASEFYKAVPTARKEDFIGDDTGQHRTIGEIQTMV